MIREYDARDHDESAVPDRREQLHEAAAHASALLPGRHRVEVVSLDGVSGGAAVVVSADPEPSEAGGYVRRALEHVHNIGGALGLLPDQPPEFVADPDYQETSSGAVAVHLHQRYKGIRIYEATETVRFGPDGALREVAGRTHGVEGDPDATPSLTAEDALRAAVDWLASPDDQVEHDPFGEPLRVPDLDPASFAPRRLTGPEPQPDRLTVFEGAPIEGSVPVRLLWFPLGGELRLSWELVLAFAGGAQWRLVVDANDGAVLLSRALVRSLTGRAGVLLRDGSQPREDVALPVPLDRYPVGARDELPSGFPDDWLVDETTAGANARAVRADRDTPATGRRVGDEVVFEPDDATDDLVVNLFALNGVMHDVLYLLGFRERDGNFQAGDLGRGGRSGDAVRALVHPGAVWGTANMATPVDGRPPQMNMGLVTSTGRHTAHDADVVIHEYTHGLTNRLVGGPMDAMALDAVQSGGMGEGWGDYFACVLNDRQTVGSWVVDRPGGIRGHAYTEDYPDDFGDLGTGRFTGVHALGEIWCATLLAMNRRIGIEVGAQLVVDALKLSAANPSFLAMRDAILVAAEQYAASSGLDEQAAADLRHGVWEAFAKFGMGPGARTQGATLSGIVADFTVPAREDGGTLVVGAAAPNLPIPDNRADGVTSTIELVTDGVLRDLEIRTDIEHPYRGDLVVTLRSPDGAEVRLHDRTGGRADDLVASFTAAARDDLARLLGGTAGGTWTLNVADRAWLDTGRLRGWEVRARVTTSRALEVLEAEPALAIPDDDPDGVSSTVTAAHAGTVRAARLDLDITHTWIGDLEVALHAPDGRRADVHQRGGGAADDLVATFTSEPGDRLESLVGGEAGGEWRLHVADHAGRDVGKLNRWRLALER